MYFSDNVKMSRQAVLMIATVALLISNISAQGAGYSQKMMRDMLRSQMEDQQRAGMTFAQSYKKLRGLMEELRTGVSSADARAMADQMLSASADDLHRSGIAAAATRSLIDQFLKDSMEGRLKRSGMPSDTSRSVADHVLRSQLLEDVAKQERLSQPRSSTYNLIQKRLKVQMDAEDSRKSRGNMEPVAHNAVRQALKEALKNEHRFNEKNRPLHQAVRQAIMNGLLVEHNPRSGSRAIHDAVRQVMKVQTGAESRKDHDRHNAIDNAVVNRLLGQSRGQNRINNLLGHVLRMRLEEEDVSGLADRSNRPVHNSARQVIRNLLDEKDAASSVVHSKSG